ncbi:MAG: Smr/MutS family protein [Spirochaetaceae bacterium]|nr:Smr/MutS family protein [Spirochaetaceae bacterium]
MLPRDSLALLEFDVIRGRVAGYAKNAESERRVLRETPWTMDEAAFQAMRDEVRFITARLASGDREPSAYLPDIGPLLPRLGVEGVVLGLDAVFAVGVFLREGATLLRWLAGDEAGGVPGSVPSPEGGPLLSLAGMGSRGPPRDTSNSVPSPEGGPLQSLVGMGSREAPGGTGGLRGVEEAVFRVVDHNGVLRDLPSLRAIKKNIAALEHELQGLVKRYYADPHTRGYLQSDVPPERDGRLVIALKANHRGKIRGLVREVSATGQTLFLEPDDVVEKNNALVIEKRAYEVEVARILGELSARIGAESAALREFYEAVVAIDVLRAKAKYSFETGGVFAGVSPDGTLRLNGARHPLLGEKAVPLDFEMGAGCSCVVITGPNAGGKTVTLKTAGLFALMNQAGLALPAMEGTRLPFFDAVYADIGDDQSITQSLSTFSAHIKHISSIIERATARSLVLLDELGSGTDPLEGGAIAMAVADYFTQARIKTLVTTHHGGMKNYAWTHEGVENASLAFDENTLAPAYRVVMGVPGESHALHIAERNALPVPVVMRAREFLQGGDADVAALIRVLSEKRAEAERLKERLLAEKAALTEERRRADLRELRLRQKENEILRGEAGVLRGYLRESRKELENLVKELREGEITREKTRKVKDFIAALEEKAAASDMLIERVEREAAETERALRESGRESQENGPKSNNVAQDAVAHIPWEPGTVVLTGPHNLRGVVKRRVKQGFYAVEIGSVTMTLPETDLRAARVEKREKAGLVPSVQVEIAASPPLFELNLRGMRAEEAVDALRTQLDGAIIKGLRSFAVVHGKGDGILSRAVHDYLKSRPEVAAFGFSRPELGGFGRTEVALTE